MGVTSGEDDKDEAEKDSCNMFRNISENLHHLDKELALVLCKNISLSLAYFLLTLLTVPILVIGTFLTY